MPPEHVDALVVATAASTAELAAAMGVNASAVPVMVGLSINAHRYAAVDVQRMEIRLGMTCAPRYEPARSRIAMSGYNELLFSVTSGVTPRSATRSYPPVCRPPSEMTVAQITSTEDAPPAPLLEISHRTGRFGVESYTDVMELEWLAAWT